MIRLKGLQQLRLMRVAPRPGADTVSAGLGGGSVTLDGTAMASRHVAGVAALCKQRNPGATPKGIAFRLDDQSTEDILSCLSPGSPNRLLHTGGL
ncbi:hypothetical protein ACFRQM_45330 [Streptomyces sp. NPDC056831]|uniref:hypothetical protein n=1 Tax=Streptomyces sp. NPDC056831 TaxID=3345954 RepID=UPI003695C055